LYFPDETIWFKAYVVNRSKTISAMSEMLYADLISPKGSVVKTLRLPVRNGYSYGSFHIDKDWVGGIYSLKMYTNWMRNFGEENFYTKKITVQKVVQPNLLMKLDFAKEGYGKSSEVTANFEVQNLKNEPLAHKEISMAVMIAGKSFLTKKLKTDTEGKLNPSFVLPDNLETTDVIINLLIPYNGSTESISRSVPVLLDNIDLQFFPESGKLISGSINTIAFKALNEFGKPADVSGKIVDEEGNHIVDFVSFHDGMGGFELEPIAGKKYFANITAPFVSKKQIVLPEVHNEGVRFSLDEVNKATKVSIFSTRTEALQLRISNSLKILLKQDIKSSEKELLIDTSKFPMGITKFSILDEKGNILAERLIFLNSERQLSIDIQVDKEAFDTREKVAVTIKTSDESGAAISSNLSIAVADNKLLSFADDKQDHILSYLLLSSELKGKIHEPLFYFDAEEVKAKKALDYVLLTHGWRDYTQENNILIMNAKYQPEQLAVQNGVVVDTQGNPRKAHLLLFDTNSDRVLDFETNDKGEFSFKLADSNRFTLVAYTNDNTSLVIQSKTRNNGFSSSRGSKKGIPNSDTPKDFYGVKKPNQEPIEKEAKASLSLSEDASKLEEVIVVGYGVTRKANATGSVVSVSADELLNEQSIVSALQGRAAGVQITNTSGVPGAGTKINIRGNASISGTNQPMIVVDGIPVQFNGQIDIDTDQIESVSVLKDLAATTLYGSAASNGVLLISTKSGRSYQYGKKKLNNKKYKNYASKDFYYFRGNSMDSPAKFYVPVYEGENLPEERTDFRPMIYWNPVVQTNDNGEANFEFYNSDAITSFKITAEGIGYNGLVGRQEKDYRTKKMLNIDFKSPSYMTIGDVVTLPLTIINDSEETLFSTLKLELPKHLKLAAPIDTLLNIAAKSSILKNVRVIAMKKGANVKIRTSVRSNIYQDVMHKEVTILSPYFPIQTSISGTESQSFEFDINHVVPNSITADFTLYTDIVGDVMNGVESLLRQPSGCFEQVSSTTYPNVLVLKYLREAGKNKPRIEKRAQKLIADGYRRLAAYETKENGFEWYGNTPPHEALSAYGLMQFNEMADVFDGVDQKMVQRTVDWLLSRRNGKGGFLQNGGKYGFSGAPADVNNAYIVYALTETYSKTELEKEYRAVYFDALDSLDTYKLALTALSSHNLKKTSDYENLMSYIKLNIKNHGFGKLPVKNTITRSSGSSKNIETTAFTLLALLRDYASNELVIKEGIEHLMSKRNYGRFGSTQPTAMALKVLISYAKVQKEKILSDGDVVELHLNGKVLHENVRMDETGKIRIDSLQKYITEGKQTVTIKFSNPKVSFPYNMNVQWHSNLPDPSDHCKVALKTEILDGTYKVGDIVRMQVAVTNTKKHGLPMTTAIIGIPSGASVQPWQLKEILEEKKVAYYEIFDNYLVFYWREMGPQEVKIVNLDLKAEVAGTYTAPASSVYLYYGDEYKHWIPGSPLRIMD